MIVRKYNCGKPTHGMARTRQYNIWKGMKNRCGNINNVDYYRYGGRGIKVCDRWQKFENFWDDMREGYAHNLTLDRIDNNGNYELKNCKWATKKQQANNTRRNDIIEYRGKTRTLSQWAEEYEIKRATLWRRINISRWSLDKSFNQPIINY